MKILATLKFILLATRILVWDGILLAVYSLTPSWKGERR